MGSSPIEYYVSIGEPSFDDFGLRMDLALAEAYTNLELANLDWIAPLDQLDPDDFDAPFILDMLNDLRSHKLNPNTERFYESDYDYRENPSDYDTFSFERLSGILEPKSTDENYQIYYYASLSLLCKHIADDIRNNDGKTVRSLIGSNFYTGILEMREHEIFCNILEENQGFVPKKTLKHMITLSIMDKIARHMVELMMKNDI